MATGTLFVVATPIGNLRDLSQRGSEILVTADVCYAEDTRRTGRLLAHLGGHTRLRSLHRYNERARVAEAIARLDAGETVALASDSGTPTVSDPGWRLVEAALEAGHRVTPIPGASAVPTALSAAGLPADRFLFAGFAPRKGREREEWIEQVLSSPHTVVAFEAPGRLAALLADLASRGAADRELVVCRELTKIHEEIRRATIAEMATVYEGQTVKGEVTIVMAGAPADVRELTDVTVEAIQARMNEMATEGRSRREIADELKERFGLTRNEAYRFSLGPGERASD